MKYLEETKTLAALLGWTVHQWNLTQSPFSMLVAPNPPPMTPEYWLLAENAAGEYGRRANEDAAWADLEFWQHNWYESLDAVKAELPLRSAFSIELYEGRFRAKIFLDNESRSQRYGFGPTHEYAFAEALRNLKEK